MKNAAAASVAEPGSLATKTSRCRIHAPPNHPQNRAKFAGTLEAWFDAGLTLEPKEDGRSAGLNGALLLPRGYAGFTDESPLLEALVPRILVWPVRFDIGDFDVDTSVPRTFYHFTNRSMLEKLARECVEEGQEQNPHHEAISMAYRLVLEDCRERDPARDSGHDHSADLELCTLEPSKFQSREDVLRNIMGEIPVVSRRSSRGHALESFADCCVAVRVPGSVCMPKGFNDAMVSVKYDKLHALHKRAAARRSIAEKLENEKAQIQQEQTEQATQEKKEMTPTSCLALLCGHHESVVSYFPRRKKKKKQADPMFDAEVLDRPKRELDFYTRKLNRIWMREHFVKMHKSRELDRQVEMVKQEKDATRAERRMAKLEAEKRRAAMDGHFRFTIAGEKEKRRKALKAREERERQARERAFEETMSEKKDDPALKAYEQWMRESDEDKDMARAALVRIKLPRQAPHQHHGARQEGQKGA